MKRIKLKVNLDFNISAAKAVSPSMAVYEKMEQQVISAGNSIIKDDPEAEITFIIDLEDNVWVKSRRLHEILSTLMDIRGHHIGFQPLSPSSRIDDHQQLKFRRKFQSYINIGEHDNQLVLTQRLRTQEDVDLGLLHSDGDDEIYSRDVNFANQIIDRSPQ